jgi:hypothetical protein
MANGHYDQSSTTSTYDWQPDADLMGWALTSGFKGMFYGSEDTGNGTRGRTRLCPISRSRTVLGVATIAWFSTLDGWQKPGAGLRLGVHHLSRGTKLGPITPGGRRRPVQTTQTLRTTT